jgi:hypothetical protein
MPGLSQQEGSASDPQKRTCASPGFDTLFGEEHLSDLTVQICEEPGAECGSGQVSTTLPAHKVVLYVHSPCFKAKVRVAVVHKNTSHTHSSLLKESHVRTS